MASRYYIAKETGNGFDFFYVHNGSNPAYGGLELLEKYTTEETVSALIASNDKLGNVHHADTLEEFIAMANEYNDMERIYFFDTNGEWQTCDPRELREAGHRFMQNRMSIREELVERSSTGFVPLKSIMQEALERRMYSSENSIRDDSPFILFMNFIEMLGVSVTELRMDNSVIGKYEAIWRNKNNTERLSVSTSYPPCPRYMVRGEPLSLIFKIPNLSFIEDGSTNPSAEVRKEDIAFGVGALSKTHLLDSIPLQTVKNNFEIVKQIVKDVGFCPDKISMGEDGCSGSFSLEWQIGLNHAMKRLKIIGIHDGELWRIDDEAKAISAKRAIKRVKDFFHHNYVGQYLTTFGIEREFGREAPWAKREKCRKNFTTVKI